jgi:hypothetical protein
MYVHFWLNKLEVNREMKNHLSEFLDDKCFLFKAVLNGSVDLSSTKDSYFG